VIRRWLPKSSKVLLSIFGLSLNFRFLLSQNQMQTTTKMQKLKWAQMGLTRTSGLVVLGEWQVDGSSRTTLAGQRLLSSRLWLSPGPSPGDNETEELIGGTRQGQRVSVKLSHYVDEDIGVASVPGTRSPLTVALVPRSRSSLMASVKTGQDRRINRLHLTTSQDRWMQAESSSEHYDRH
jgi:hypothetical protein